MKALAVLLVVALVSACTPEIQSQFDGICTNVREARVVLANGEVDLKPNVQTAFDSADAICLNPPKDIPSAVLTLASLYLVISKAQQRAL